MFFLWIVGLGFLSLGVYRLKGPVSVSYFAYSPRMREGNSLAFPFAVTFLLWGLAISSIVPENLKMAFMMIGAVAPLVAAFYTPKFLKPKWLQWLEETHGDIIPFIQAEINDEIGIEAWDKRINTQEELESWVNEFRQREGLQSKLDI